LVILMALLFHVPSQATELTCWFSPTGTGNGSSSNSPRAFSASYINQTLLTDTGATVFNINRSALATAPSSFVPFGRVERVLPVWTNFNRAYVHRLSESEYSTTDFEDQALAGAHEVSLGVPSIVSANLQVPVRLVLQQTPMVGGGVTVPVSSKLVWVKATGAISSTQWATTDSTGLATVTLSISGVTHGEILLTAFHDPRTTNGASGSFDEYQVAWARGTAPIGTVIQVVAAPDVAVDRREGSVQTAQFKLRRSGPAVVNTTNYPALDVSFELPQSSGNRTATLTTDYSITAVSPTTRTLNGNPVGPHTVRFAAGETTALLTITPVTDNVIEKEIVWLRLLTGSGYALGTRTEARTYIYDGPEWTLVEITHSQNPYSGVTRPAGINNDLDGSSNPDPRVAADAYVMRTNNWGSPIYGYTGGSWRSTWTEPTALIDLTLTSPLSPIVTGISDTSSGSFRMSGWKGETGGGTRAIKADQTGWWYLTVPPSGQDEGWFVDQNKGLCISPNKNYVGGYCWAWRLGSPNHYEERPVGWNGTTFIDLGVEDFTNVNGGEALGVNDQGEFVGERVLIDELELPTFRAFRTRPEGQAITTQDLLPPPSQLGFEDHEIPAIARAISPGTSTTSGIALGDAVKNPGSSVSQVLPVWWGSRAKESGVWEANPRGIFGKILEARSLRHASWVTISISGSNYELFGWEKAEGESTTSAAWWPSYWDYGVRLNDAYAVMGIGNGSTWKLFEIVDANNSRWLLGRATKNNSDRAVLLVPQTVQP